MKNQLVKLMMVSIIVFGASLFASAQVYVKVRPVAPVVVMSARPSPAHIWIGEEWNEEGGNYKYSGGHWDTPPHPGDRWNPGRWNHDKEHGDHWTRGSWKGGGKR
jgi:hypothetical protein